MEYVVLWFRTFHGTRHWDITSPLCHAPRYRDVNEKENKGLTVGSKYLRKTLRKIS